ncbi:MAG: hypothetical protein AABY34_01210 [Pseudomonadota bacterium]
MNGLKNDNEYSGLLKYAESRLSQIYDNSQRQDHQLALTQLIANAIKEQQDSAPKEVFDRLMEGVSKLEQRIAADHPEHDRSRSTVFGSALAFFGVDHQIGLAEKIKEARHDIDDKYQAAQNFQHSVSTDPSIL